MFNLYAGTTVLRSLIRRYPAKWQCPKWGTQNNATSFRCVLGRTRCLPGDVGLLGRSAVVCRQQPRQGDVREALHRVPCPGQREDRSSPSRRVWTAGGKRFHVSVLGFAPKV